MPKLVGVIFCYASPETIMSRILSRNRQQESSVNYNLMLSLLDFARDVASTINSQALHLKPDEIDPYDAANTIHSFVESCLQQRDLV
jgi:deoxyadenosine/deoxycytidine kinase